jgi:glycerate kinase
MISRTVLVLAESFGEAIDATQVAKAIERGLQTDAALRCDLCPLEGDASEQARERTGGAATLLDSVDFDRRMLSARAVVIARERLDDSTLAGSVAFEAATRARQRGVPAYAVTGRDELDPFEARIVDLQVILEASTPRALSAAGKKLAALL